MMLLIIVKKLQLQIYRNDDNAIKLQSMSGGINITAENSLFH